MALLFLVASSAGCPERVAEPDRSATATDDASTSADRTRGGTTSSQPPGRAAGKWSGAGQLSHARAELSLVRLDNGEVLAIGGEASFSPSAAVDRFDPKTSRWTKASALMVARHHHSSVLLADGRVMVVGGIGKEHDRLASVEMFDPKTATWKSAAPLNSGRSNHSAMVLPNGHVLVVGGRDENDECVASCARYDPAKNKWTKATPLPSATCDLSLLKRADDILALGGISRDGVRGMLAFSSSTGKWTKRAAPSTRREAHAVTLFADGRVMITGGNAGGRGGRLSSSQMYQTTGDAWQPAAALLGPRVAHSATLLTDGRVLVSGGRADDNLATTEIYVPSQKRWLRGPQMPQPRSAHQAIALEDGRVLVAGGYVGTGARVAPSPDTAVFQAQ